ncbi:MAG: hypothetical protein IIA45_08890 [Bacteroidetes bacterium]|nr:hypothetical protein [Bacteroidota bacterium]
MIFISSGCFLGGNIDSVNEEPDILQKLISEQISDCDSMIIFSSPRNDTIIIWDSGSERIDTLYRERPTRNGVFLWKKQDIYYSKCFEFKKENLRTFNEQSINSEAFDYFFAETQKILNVPPPGATLSHPEEVHSVQVILGDNVFSIEIPDSDCWSEQESSRIIWLNLILKHICVKTTNCG